MPTHVHSSPTHMYKQKALTQTYRSALLRLQTEIDRNSPETAYASDFDSLDTMC